MRGGMLRPPSRELTQESADRAEVSRAVHQKRVAMSTGKGDEPLRLRGQREEPLTMMDRDDIVGAGVQEQLGKAEPADLAIALEAVPRDEPDREPGVELLPTRNAREERAVENESRGGLPGG